MKKMVMAGALTLVALQGCFSVLSASPLIAAVPKAAMQSMRSGQPVVLAQSVDAEMRIQQLEEQIRGLNGRIEEMSFQLLQMQETLRKTQEDNEFRFQDLEKGTKKSGALEKAPGQATEDVAAASGDQTPEASDALDQPVPSEDLAATDGANGQPAVSLGKIKIDENGNVLGAENPVNPADPSDPVQAIIKGNPQTAAVEGQDGAYQAAYEHILSGDYAAAENQFRAYIDAYPEGAKVADASFWLGESQYSQAKYSEAAKTFLNAYKTYGKSEKAPEMLLKLAMSLAALDSKDTACATLREVTKTYPKASRAIVSKVASEQKRLAC